MSERKKEELLQACPAKCLRCRKHTEERPETICRLIQGTSIKNDFYCSFFEGDAQDMAKNEALLKQVMPEGDAEHYPHSIVIEFDYQETELDELFIFERQLEKLVRKNKAGKYDGHELALDGTGARLYLYAHDADALFKLVRPMLEVWPQMKNGVAVLKFGEGMNAPQIEIRIDTDG